MITAISATLVAAACLQPVVRTPKDEPTRAPASPTAPAAPAAEIPKAPEPAGPLSKEEQAMVGMWGVDIPALIKSVKGQPKGEGMSEWALTKAVPFLK